MVFNATFNNISVISLAVSFVGRWNWIIQRKPTNFSKSTEIFLIAHKFGLNLQRNYFAIALTKLFFQFCTSSKGIAVEIFHENYVFSKLTPTETCKFHYIFHIKPHFFKTLFQSRLLFDFEDFFFSTKAEWVHELSTKLNFERQKTHYNDSTFEDK
jgi:hypothetical protein